MKKILFRKLLKDCLTFFLIALISGSVIIWIFQAVNFLDIIVEDGRDYLVYIQYSLLNFPKIISKILPFALFFSFAYVLTRYELDNELMIFWNFGVHKIELVNFFIKFSILITLVQLFFTVILVPEAQYKSRSLIKSSDVDFFESFVKPKKFNDNITGLTIYAEEKDKFGNLKKIYLKKNENKKEFQITIAKRGEFKTLEGSKILTLYDGETIKNVNNKLTNFSFTKSDFSLSVLDTDIIVFNKMQETKTFEHINCVKKYFNNNLKRNLKQLEWINHNCSLDSLDNLFQELYKRIIVPFYIPILILTSLYLIMFSKEHEFYKKSRSLIFLSGFLLIVFSEVLLKFIIGDFYKSSIIIILPFIVFTILYFYLKLKLSIKFKMN